MKKFLAVLLTLLMLISAVPLSVFAANDYTINSTTSTDGYYNLISKKDWDIAPGITESEIVLNNDSGSRRQVLFVMEADLNNEYVKVINSYNGMVPEYGNYKTGVMSEQTAYAEANGYGNVVGAMNTTLSWYTGYAPDRVGEPLGFIMLDAEILFDPSNCGYTYGKVGFPSVVVINKDFDENGNPRPDYIPKVEMPQITSAADLDGWEEQVIPCSSGYIVKDGKNMQKSANHSDAAPRSVVGIKPDGTVVIMLNDGRQEPYSAGMSMYELAEVMLDLGCTFAVNCDGGGSSTYLSQRPGEELKVNNSPSDGAERPTTTGILFISTAPSDGAFARATLSTENTYYTPGSTVKFDALGTDLVGTPAEIPADVVWQLSDPTMGTIENGVFVSNGKVGTATAQMVYDGKVVGEHSIEIVIPTEFSFSQAIMTVPFDKEVTIGLTATINNGLNNVVLKPEDVSFATTNDLLGTLNGFTFTSVSEADAPANLTSTLTATLVHNPELVATAALNLGKGSEVLFDFEDITDVEAWNIADVNGNDKGFYQNVSLATESDGMVHNGNSSMRVEMNPISANGISNGGYGQSDLYLDEGIVVENAKSIGFWAYIPDEYEHCWIRVLYWYDSNNDGVYDKKNTISVINQPDVYNKFDESGWKYFSVDVSKYSEVLIPGVDCKDRITYNSAKNDANNFRFIEFMFPHTNTNDLWKSYGTINGLQTVYIDNITADYSDAVDDREAPVFGDVSLVETEKTTVLKKYNTVTTKSNLLTLNAVVSEDTTKSNFTGLNINSAKAYVDGVEVDVTYSNGKLAISDIAVADGIHRVKFEICDNMGNKSVVIRLVNVASGVDASTVQVVPADTSLDNLYGGSVYWMNMNANKIETIQSVNAVIDLNYGNHFELDQIVLADGFTSTYTIDEENNTASITITRTGENTQTGEATLAALPVRVIYYDTDINIEGYTAETYWNTYEFWPYDLKVDVDMGEITYVDGYDSAVIGAFSNEEFSVDTELQTAFSNSTFKTERGTAHVHTAVALDDLDSTCITSGYTDRTFCEVCNSVVDWGTTISAKGHKWEVNAEGKLACDCGKLFNGIYTDGVTYIDGVAISDGWNADNTSYYMNGKKLTGSHVIDGVMCTFDQNGIYLKDYIYDGWYEVGDTAMFFMSNKYLTGYHKVDSQPHFFNEDGTGYDGEYTINGMVCTFDNGRFVSCENEDVLEAGWYGAPENENGLHSVEYMVYSDASIHITGSGKMMNVTEVGLVPWSAYVQKFIKSIFIAKDITNIGHHSFRNCFFATSVTFEEGSQVTEIGACAFYNMRSIKSIVLPENVQVIGSNALGYTFNLTRVYLPEGVRTINNRAFVKSHEDLVLQVAEGTIAHSFAINNGFKVELRSKKPVVTASGVCGDNATWTLYDGVRLVIDGSGAMTDYANRDEQPWAKYRNQITQIEIGKDITYIGKYAFAYSYNVNSVTFEEGSQLESIGSFAIYYMYRNLTELVLPETVKTLAGQAIAYNNNLKNVYIPQGITSISSYTFRSSNNVVLDVAAGTYAESFAIKNNIDYNTREYVYLAVASGTCGTNATWIFYEDGKLVIDGSGAMSDFANRDAQPWAQYREKITQIVIGKDITHLGKYAFAYSYNVKSVTFEEGSKLQSINSFAIYYMYRNLTELNLPETVRTIYGQALGYNNVLVDVYVPQNINFIASNAFLNSKKVVLNVVKDTYAESFAVNNDLSYITRDRKDLPIAEGTCGDNATWSFYDNGKLIVNGNGAMYDFVDRDAQPWAVFREQITDIVIGKDITHIGKYAFAYSYNVRTIVFEEDSKLESVGALSIFYMYRYLNEVKLPESVKTIYGQAFGYNYKLESVYIPESVTFVASNAFLKSDNVILNVVEGSYAETFAKTNNIVYDLTK